MSRISPGTIIVGIFAVLFGLIGAYAVRQHLAPKPAPEPQEEPAPPPLQLVPMASSDLKSGRPLTFGDIAVTRMTPEEIAKRELPPNYMTSPEQIIGRVLREPLEQGEVFMTTAMYPEDMLPTVAERLASGLRAVTVPMQENGLAAPGSVIDVIFRSTADEEGHRPQATLTLLEEVEILAVGRNEVPGRRSEPNAPATVTLAVSPEQANALKVVEGHGELHLAMRNPTDAEVAAPETPQTLDGLLGLRTPTTYSTDIYRGTKKTTMSFAGERDEPLVMTRFPIGPDRVTSTTESDPEATAPTSLRKEDSQPEGEPSSSRKETSEDQKLGLSGLPLLSVAASETDGQDEHNVVHVEAAGGN